MRDYWPRFWPSRPIVLLSLGVFNHFAKNLKRYREEEKVVVLLVLMTSAVTCVYFITIRLPIGEYLHSFAGHGWVPIRYGTAHLVNLLTIIGLAVTGIGTAMTYRQARESFQRIETYSQLFDAIEQVIAPFKSRDVDDLYIYGAMLLPGSIASNDRNRVKQMHKSFMGLLNHEDNTSRDFSDAKVRLLIPDETLTKQLFALYENPVKENKYTEIAGLSASSPGELLQKINFEFKNENKLVAKAEESKKEYPNQFQIHRLKHTDANARVLEGEYFISNGRRSVHVVFLHYIPNPKTGQMIPALLGVNTIDATITQGLIRRFLRLGGEEPSSVAEAKGEAT